MPLTRAAIIAAAVRLIEHDGADGLSMRGLAADLGCGVMSLYNHVDGKSAVLDGVAEHVMSGIIVPAVPGAGWQDQVKEQARAFRRIARAYPRCTMVVVSRPAGSTAALAPTERALATLDAAGFSGPDSVRIVRLFVAYILGCLLREVGMAHPDEDAAQRLPLDRAQFPVVIRLAPQLMDADPDADFEFGLDVLVRAVAARLPAAR